MSLEDIKARAEAISGGPWMPARAATPDGQYLTKSTTEKAEFLYLSLNDDESDLWLVDDGEVIPAVTGDGPNAKANADFIAHARTDIPKLLAAIEAALELSDYRQRIQPYEVREAITEALGD